MTMTFSYVDIFAGCGGISLGLHNAGWKGIFAVEKSHDAFLTLKHNLLDTHSYFDWPNWLEKKNWDINELLIEKKERLIELRGKVDLVAGGPPCQGFSIAGKRDGKDERNKLIHSYLKFVEFVEPKVILFENVSGFTYTMSTSETEEGIVYSDLVIDELIKLGYEDAHGKMINFSEYGVPQRRNRFIVVATKDGLSSEIFSVLEKNKSPFLKNKGLKELSTVFDAISDLHQSNGEADCPDTANFKSGFISKANSDLQKYLRIGDEVRYIPDSHRFVNHKNGTVDIFKVLLEKAPRDTIIKGEQKSIYGIKKRSITVLDSNLPTPTITTIPDDFVHYSEPRVMTVRECARLQTFPDWFEFKGNYTSGGKVRKEQTPRYTQVGNAVPPLFAEQLGAAIKQVLNNG